MPASRFVGHRLGLGGAVALAIVSDAGCQSARAPAVAEPPDCRVLSGVFIAGDAAYRPASGPIVVGGDPPAVLPGCTVVDGPRYQEQEDLGRRGGICR